MYFIAILIFVIFSFLIYLRLGKLILLITFIIVSNLQWAFILFNWEGLNRIIEIKNQNNYSQERENEYGDSIYDVYLGFDDIIDNKVTFDYEFIPNSISIPSINVESPIFISNNNSIDDLLLNGVVNYPLPYSFNYETAPIFIFGHSSSSEQTEYSNIFLEIIDLKEGNKVYIEDDDEIKIYEYRKGFSTSRSKLNEIEKKEKQLLLITCYPFFIINDGRYVVELEEVETIYK